MSIKEIINSSFALAPLNGSAYELKIQFADDQEGLVSNKTFIFSQKVSPKEGEILDVYSQNGTCKDSILNHLFEKKDEKGIQKVLKKPLPAGPTLLVLDLKDPHTQYSPCEECHRQLHRKM